MRRSKVLVLALGSLLLVASCAGTKPQMHEFERTKTIHADFDAVWFAVIEIFAERMIPIVNLEKVSGLIVSLETPVDASTCDCGVDVWHGDANFAGCLAVFNVFVKEVGESSTKVMITARYASRFDANKLCTSTGSFETHLFRLIAQKAESAE